MALSLPKNIQDYQGRNMTNEEIQSVEQFKADKEMHRLIRKQGGPEVYSIYAHLLDSANPKHDWGCWPTYESIMDDLGILNRPVIAEALHWLFDAGLMEWGLEGRKSWFIPLRKANSSVIELLKHIPSFRNRTINSSGRERKIVLIENANVYQSNVIQKNEEETLDTSVSNGPSGPTENISIPNSENNITDQEAANVETAPPPDRRGFKQRWREAYEAVKDDFRARSGVMGSLWTEVTGIPPDYKQLNGLAKDYNSMWAVCEGIFKLANYEVVDDPLVFLRKVLSNDKFNTGGTNRGRSERAIGKNSPNPAFTGSKSANDIEPGLWEKPDAEERARAAWHV